MEFAVESHSARETKAWGRRLGSLLKGGEILGLIGDLGAGKTCFVKGLARGLSLDPDRILSPTFTMIQEHRGRLMLYHIDLYRLETTRLDELGLREYLFSDGVAAVEWFERLQEAAQLEFLSIEIGYTGADSRSIRFSSSSDRYHALIEQLRTHL